MEIAGGHPLVARDGIPRPDAGDQRPVPFDYGLQPPDRRPGQYSSRKEDSAPIQRRKDVLTRVTLPNLWKLFGLELFISLDNFRADALLAEVLGAVCQHNSAKRGDHFFSLKRPH